MLSKIIKNTPIPIAGLMLALASLGNLVVRHGIIYKNILGALAGIIFMLLFVKVLAMTKAVIAELNNPVILSVAPTFSMGMMVLATYIKPYSFEFAFAFWIISIIIHIALMAVFVKRHIFNFDINKVFASYFIVFVGIVVASVTAPAFKMQSLGIMIFYFGLSCYLVLLPVVLFRIYKVKNIPQPAKPTVAILAAPASLCLAGYLSSFASKNSNLALFLLGLAILFAVLVLVSIPSLVKKQFFASYSALTFPFAITAIALRKATVFANKANLGLTWLNTIAQLAEIWALLIVFYVFIRYCVFYINLVKPQKKLAKAL